MGARLKALLVALTAFAAVGCDPAPPEVSGDICDEGTCSIFGCPSECSTICNDTGCRPVDTFVGDSEPPSTTLMVCRGNLPSLSVRSASNGGCVNYDVSATDKAKPDLLNQDDDDQFRHVYWMSGDPACVGTGKPIGSGRDCTSDSPDGQCAYISEGFSIFAVTGSSCSEAGIGLCQGPFCT